MLVLSYTSLDITGSSHPKVSYSNNFKPNYIIDQISDSPHAGALIIYAAVNLFLGQKKVSGLFPGV